MPANKNPQHSKYRRSRGQSLIEFAITLPVLLLVIIGAMDLGRMFFTKIVITNAAREGANFLALHSKDYQNCVNSTCFYGTWIAIRDEGESSGVSLGYSDVDWVNTNCSAGCTPGSPVEITVTTTVDLVFSTFFQSVGLAGGPIQLSSTVKMVSQ